MKPATDGSPSSAGGPSRFRRRFRRRHSSVLSPLTKRAKSRRHPRRHPSARSHGRRARRSRRRRRRSRRRGHVQLPGHAEAIVAPAEAGAEAVVVERHQHLAAVCQQREHAIELGDIAAVHEQRRRRREVKRVCDGAVRAQDREPAPAVNDPSTRVPSGRFCAASTVPPKSDAYMRIALRRAHETSRRVAWSSMRTFSATGAVLDKARHAADGDASRELRYAASVSVSVSVRGLGVVVVEARVFVRAPP